MNNGYFSKTIRTGHTDLHSDSYFKIYNLPRFEIQYIIIPHKSKSDKYLPEFFLFKIMLTIKYGYLKTII
jgi:hypothetical protein